MYDLNIVALHYHGVTYDELDERDKMWISEEVF